MSKLLQAVSLSLIALGGAGMMAMEAPQEERSQGVETRSVETRSEDVLTIADAGGAFELTLRDPRLERALMRAAEEADTGYSRKRELSLAIIGAVENGQVDLLETMLSKVKLSEGFWQRLVILVARWGHKEMFKRLVHRGPGIRLSERNMLSIADASAFFTLIALDPSEPQFYQVLDQVIRELAHPEVLTVSDAGLHLELLLSNSPNTIRIAKRLLAEDKEPTSEEQLAGGVLELLNDNEVVQADLLAELMGMMECTQGFLQQLVILSAQLGKIDYFKVLLEKLDASRKGVKSALEKALHEAAAGGNVEIAEYLIDYDHRNSLNLDLMTVFSSLPHVPWQQTREQIGYTAGEGRLKIRQLLHDAMLRRHSDGAARLVLENAIKLVSNFRIL